LLFMYVFISFGIGTDTLLTRKAFRMLSHLLHLHIQTLPFDTISKLHRHVPDSTLISEALLFIPLNMSLSHSTVPRQSRRTKQGKQDGKKGQRDRNLVPDYACLLLLDTSSETISNSRIACGASASASLLKSPALEWLAMEVIEFWSSISAVSEFINKIPCHILQINRVLTQAAVISSLLYRNNNCDDGDERCRKAKSNRYDGVGGYGCCNWLGLLVLVNYEFNVQLDEQRGLLIRSL
jgi:hypothetical protein